MSKPLASSTAPVQLPIRRLGAGIIAAMACLSVAVFIGAGQLGSTLRLAGATTDTTPLALRIGQHDFSIPANAVRFVEQRTAQPQGEIDLYLSWPAMTGFSEAAREVFQDPEAGSLLFLRLTATKAVPAETPAPPSTTPVAFGLNRFTRPGLPGIASEEIVYRAGLSRQPAFEASCLDGADPIMAADCIRDVQIVPGLRLRYRFSHALLTDWDRIDRAVLAYLEEHRRS